MNAKEIAIRALKTFIQAFFPVLIAGIKVCDVTDTEAFKAALYAAVISACAAGLSAVWNTIIAVKGKTNDGEAGKDETQDRADG